MRKTYVLLLLLVFSLTSYFIISCRHEPPAVLVNYVFTYGTWSACTNGAETRTYTSTPNGGTPPADSVSRTCTAPPTTCSFTYSVWSNCVSNLQIRTVTSTSPVGCTGIPPTDSLSRACSTSCPTINVSGTPASPKTNCSNDGTIVASASGGAAPYTYSKNGKPNCRLAINCRSLSIFTNPNNNGWCI